MHYPMYIQYVRFAIKLTRALDVTCTRNIYGEYLIKFTFNICSEGHNRLNDLKDRLRMNIFARIVLNAASYEPSVYSHLRRIFY